MLWCHYLWHHCDVIICDIIAMSLFVTSMWCHYLWHHCDVIMCVIIHIRCDVIIFVTSMFLHVIYRSHLFFTCQWSFLCLFLYMFTKFLLVTIIKTVNIEVNNWYCQPFQILFKGSEKQIISRFIHFYSYLIN